MTFLKITLHKSHSCPVRFQFQWLISVVREVLAGYSSKLNDTDSVGVSL
jgi:hypothetical protein